MGSRRGVELVAGDLASFRRSGRAPDGRSLPCASFPASRSRCPNSGPGRANRAMRRFYLMFRAVGVLGVGSSGDECSIAAAVEHAAARMTRVGAGGQACLRVAGVVAVSVFACPVFAAAASAAVSSTPDTTYVTNGSVNAVVRTADQIYLGGSFTQVGPRTGPWASVSAASGQVDAGTAQVSGGSAEVLATVPDGSGGFYIGGHLTHRR